MPLASGLLRRVPAPGAPGAATMRAEIAFVLLFSVATAVAILARRVRIPYTVALVATGLALGALHLGEPPRLTRDLLFAVILPGLVFEAAFHVEAAELWRNRLSLAAMAVPGVLASMGLTAAILLLVARRPDGPLSGLTVSAALVFGALIAATDPVAVVGLFRSVEAPRRLRVLVEGESLLNDGTAMALFGILVAIGPDASPRAGPVALDFLRVVGIGAAAGAAAGLLVSKVIQKIDDAMIEITLTVVAAFGSFVLAEVLGGSGVIATVAAGVLCGSYAARTGMSEVTRAAVDTFWEYVAFALNSIVFLLIGLSFRIELLLASWRAVLAAWGAVLVARAVVVAAVRMPLRLTREAAPRSWSAVIAWAGLRGALSMVLALSLPDAFPSRAVVIRITFGVVLLSILVQGLTMPTLLRALGLSSGPGRRRLPR